VPISEQLLEKLVCPQCKGKLGYNRETEKLACDDCKLVYRIEDNIPVLLVDEAEKM
jgi:uncharacterized protein YbaR (Trm112 family)